MKIPFVTSLLGTKTKAKEAGWLAVGLTSHGIYLVQLGFGGVIPRVMRCEFHETPGVATVADLEKLKREGLLGNELCTTLLSPGEYQMMLVDAPNVPASEFRQAVRWKIKDGLNYHIDAASVDMLLIPLNKSRSDRGQTLYAIAAPNEIIQKRMSLFEQAKLKLSVIEIVETAQRNVAALFEQPERALGLLAFDESGGLLTLTAGGELYVSRRIEITSGQLCDANEDLRAQCRDRVELELRRSLDFFDRQFHHLSLSGVLLSVPRESGLLEGLLGSVEVGVTMLDLSRVMDISAAPELAESDYVARFLPVLGAALRQEVKA